MIRRLIVKPALWLTLGVGIVAGCTHPKPGEVAPGEVFDPYEKLNRGTHSFNLAVDRALFRPTAKGYVSIIPAPMQDSVVYFSENLSMPRVFVNAVLQGDLKTAGTATARFLINSTVGFGGLANPATDAFNLPEADTDFGETLHVWGAKEGAYVELPFFGPSNERDAVGFVVDFFTNPITYVLPSPENRVSYAAEILERLGDRGRYSDTVDSILYDSADSYAQARLIYLQARRFDLEGADADNYVDPYSDLSADPYEDPYAE